MKKAVVLGLTFCVIGAWSYAQENKKQQDIKSIKGMCGCFEVNFKYTETFAPEIDYEKHHDYTATALEWAGLIEESDNKLSIQHLLLVGDTTIIKHWRQDWLYENQEVFYYDKDNTWNFTSLPEATVNGQWTQKVYQVDDSPRYSGSASWVHVDGRHYWENKASSPLPRREYTKRSDYNVMLRGNRHEITNYGWLHEQDNDKVIRKDGMEDVLLTQEKGYNTYTKVADERCSIAQKWWTTNKAFWSNARNSWETVYDRQGLLSLLPAVDDKPLYMHLYPLQKSTTKVDDITAVIHQFLTEKSVIDAQGK
tara:strand:+ start:504 stop:1430 length:927 start_codon:yes stop_codon:yes gene_type:complete